VSLLDPLYRRVEAWIDPFRRLPDPEPPAGLLRYLWFYVGQARWVFAALLAQGFLNAIVEASLFAFVGRIVDMLTAAEAAGARDQGWEGLLAAHGAALLLMLAVVAVGRALVIALGTVVEEQAVVAGFFTMMRWQSHKHVVRQSLSFFQNDLAGRIAQKVFQGGQAAGDVMVSLLQIIWFIVVYAATTFALMLALDWRLAALVALWVAIFAVIARHFVPRIREWGRRTAEAGSGLTGRMVDSYSNIAAIKLHGADRDEEDYVRGATDNFLANLRPFARTLSDVRITLAAMSGLMMATIGYVAIDLWIAGAISTGSVAFTLALVLRLNLLLGRLMGILNGFFRSIGTVQNTMDLVARPLEIRDAPGAPALRLREGRIEFRNVGFHYGKEGGVIDNLSFTVKPGEKLGLVGPSGAGKTTIVHLMLRFHDLEAGAILFDGQYISTVTQDSLRAQFAMVQQDSALFNRPVRDNIAHGRPGASMDEIVEAAKRAHAHDFILGLDDGRGGRGYDARVGERGVKLSGGQRQRIAIARVFLRNAPVLLLDEATSSLDSEVEAAIQENLQDLMAGKTVVAIAHRLSTIAQMDRLLVIDDGGIAEEGTHAELVARGGLYARLWRRQTGPDRIAEGVS
jgi:ATP-binding cassette subfamily B multidrug efflux pump